MAPPDCMAVLAKEVLWNRALPERVFLRQPAISVFFDGGLLGTEGFLEDVIGWSHGAFDEDDAVLAICDREDGQLLRADLLGLSKIGLSRDCRAAKRYWRSQQVDRPNRTCVLFNDGMDWMLYEEELEDFGVLVLFEEHPSMTQRPEWLALMHRFATRFDIESDVAKGPDSNLLSIYNRAFLTKLLANY